MKLKDLFSELAAGVPVKRKAWKGYWRFYFGNIEMHSKDGIIMNITDTKDILFTVSGIVQEDWEVATESNCEVLRNELTAKG